MAAKTFKFGKYACKAYKKAAGKGWEVGFSFNGKTIFTGNFIHTKEANAWWTLMNHEAKKFCRRYTLPAGASTTFFSRFMGNYLYKCYYAWLDRQFSHYNRGYAQALKKDERKWSTMHKTAGHAWGRHHARRAA